MAHIIHPLIKNVHVALRKTMSFGNIVFAGTQHLLVFTPGCKRYSILNNMSKPRQKQPQHCTQSKHEIKLFKLFTIEESPVSNSITVNDRFQTREM
jgi:hypothetical protein